MAEIPHEAGALFLRMMELCQMIEVSWFAPTREKMFAEWKEIAPEVERVAQQIREG